jgi:serine/threonine-protein kinase
MDEGNDATATARSQTLPVGEVVATKYRIEALLGSGGMAEVYAAVNLLTDRRVALKWILPTLATSKEAMARFRREALAAGRINHPNVVTIFDVVEHHSSAGLVMELLHGETLAQRLKRIKKMPIVEAVAIMLPAMRGVAAAHSFGVIHRDLKPDNLFLCLDPNGTIRDCKVLDFGVSKLTVPDMATTGDITLSGNVVGTPEYMSPEQVRSGKGIDHRVDVYALGVVFYEILVGRPPFVGEHFSGLMLDIMQREPPPLVSLRSDVPKRLASVIHHALEKDVARRFPDVPSFIQAVEAAGREDLNLPMGTPPEGLITQIGLARSTPETQLMPSWRLGPRPRARLRLALIAAGVGLAVGAMALAYKRAGGPAPHAPDSPATAEAVPSVAVAPPAPQPAPTPPVLPAAPVAAAPVAPPPTPTATTAASASPRGPRRGAAHAHEADEPTTSPTPIAPAVPAPQPQQRTPRAGKLTIDDF